MAVNFALLNFKGEVITGQIVTKEETYPIELLPKIYARASSTFLAILAIFFIIWLFKIIVLPNADPPEDSSNPPAAEVVQEDVISDGVQEEIAS